VSYDDYRCPLSFAIYLLKFSHNPENCQPKIARQIRIPTIMATMNPTIPTIMSKFAPLLPLLTFSCNTVLIFKDQPRKYVAEVNRILRILPILNLCRIERERKCPQL
jgi:hypothetical protein